MINNLIAKLLVGICAWLAINSSAFAAERESFPVPRFVTLKSDEVNSRAGPDTRYPIRWTYVRKGEPVEVVAEYDLWREIKDFQGEKGWVHKSMLSGKRAVIVTSNELVTLTNKPADKAQAVGQMEPGVRAELLACKGDWCRIQAGEVAGWISRQSLWGVYAKEKFP